MHLVAHFVTALALVSAGDGVSPLGVNAPATTAAANPSATAPALPAANAAGLKLAPRKSTGLSEGQRPFIAAPTGPLAGMFGSLAAVLALFFLCVIFFRSSKGKSSQALPPDVIEVLGRTAFNGKQQLQLVRVGRKLLLVVVSPAGTETLTEISDAHEVDRLIGICQQNNPNSISATFRQVLQQIGTEPAPGGFWGREKVA